MERYLLKFCHEKSIIYDNGSEKQRGLESYELEEDTKSTGICHTFDTIIVMPAPNQPLQTPSKGKNRLAKLYPLKMPGKL